MRAIAVLASLCGAIAAAECLADPVDFARDVRPILSDKCYACHGPDAEQRQGGDDAGFRLDTREGALAAFDDRRPIVPGQPDKSELIARIHSEDEFVVMPPPDQAKQLTAAEKKTLRDWIEQGAAWSDHWAYVPPRRHPVPPLPSGMRANNAVDHFIAARLHVAGLTQSPEADRRTLLRRLSFDLIGLPPTPQEVADFLADDSPDAYQRQVDRLLASPHFGERMAIYWLDLVRYADSVGYHGDQPVNVSPYRDYVIDAFNRNVPFDQFTREQLAGDLLPNATREQQVASGYNRLGMMSAEGGVQPKEYLAKYAADRVRTAASVWLGSTLGCAECHDHKFDPFTAKDFYQFASFFADIKEKGLYSGASRSGDFGPEIEVPSNKLPELLKPLDEQLAQLQARLETSTPELESSQRAWETTQQTTVAWHAIEPESATALHGAKLTVQPDRAILASGPSPRQDAYTIKSKLPLDRVTGLRIEALPDKSLPKGGPGRAGNGNFVLSELRLLAPADQADTKPSPVQLQNATATFEQDGSRTKIPGKKWSAALTIDNDKHGKDWGWAVMPQPGKPNHMVVELAQPVAQPGDAIYTFVLEFNYPGGGHGLGKFRISVTDADHPLTADPRSALPENIRAILAVQRSQRTAPQQAELAAYYRSIAPALDDTRKQIASLQKQKESLTKAHLRTSLVTVSVAPREMRVLPRGNWMDTSGEVVSPGVPHFLRAIETEARATRLDLANWITARDNPLTARVFVNRLWYLYFGTGLSKVLDDLGAQGEAPSHPQLLDNLAVEFMEEGWDVKHMIKQIVMSATYRQSSAPREELATRDPYNRLLARQARYRFDAEVIRDNLLAVSGLLVDEVGGRSVKPYQPAGLYRHLNFPKRTYQADTGQDQYRRGVYTHWQRQFLHPALKAFDAPSREECTAQRSRSNTPLGALVLLNDPSYVEAARVFAAEALRAGGDTPAARFEWMLQRALSRSATPREEQLLGQLLAAQLEHYQQDEAAARELIQVGQSPMPENIPPAELAAWTGIARTIFNLHEFITRN